MHKQERDLVAVFGGSELSACLIWLKLVTSEEKKKRKHSTSPTLTIPQSQRSSTPRILFLCTVSPEADFCLALSKVLVQTDAEQPSPFKRMRLSFSCKTDKLLNSDDFTAKGAGYRRTCNVYNGRKKGTKNKENLQPAVPQAGPSTSSRPEEPSIDARNESVFIYLTEVGLGPFLRSLATSGDIFSLAACMNIAELEGDRRERADKLATAIWDQMKFRFVYHSKYDHVRTDSTRFMYHCAQVDARQHKPKSRNSSPALNIATRTKCQHSSATYFPMKNKSWANFLKIEPTPSSLSESLKALRAANNMMEHGGNSLELAENAWNWWSNLSSEIREGHLFQRENMKDTTLRQLQKFRKDSPQDSAKKLPV
ncbi:hypothetical protein C8J56DRAFT_1025491 [Mycena floridula]|nr:hypothetical protein C8J56DRAFT_1025491 [Mycena floridula]